MDGSLSIIKLFCRDLTRELTIRQISKLIKKSYAYTNKEVWNLIKQEVLFKKEIGKSVVCSINIKNQRTRALLVFNSMLNQKLVSQDILDKIANALTAFYSNKKLIIIKNKSEFTKELGLDNEVIYGHEKYWELVGDIYE